MAAPMKFKNISNIFIFLKNAYFPRLLLINMNKNYEFYSQTFKFSGMLHLNYPQRDHNRRTQNKKSFSLPSAGLLALIGFSKKTEEEKDELILTLKKAKLAEKKQKFEKANRFYHKALGIATMRHQNHEITQDEWITKRNYIFIHMANLAFGMFKLEAAEKLFKDAMRGYLEAGLEKDDNALVEISMKLAMLYAMQEKHEEAVEGYKFAIEAQERKMSQSEVIDENTIALWGMCLDAFSKYFLTRNNYRDAYGYTERALTVAIQVFGENHPQTATLWNDLANISYLMGNIDNAISQCEKAVELGELLQIPELAAFYCNLGSILLHNGEFEKAFEKCTKASKLAQDRESRKQARGCLKDIKAKKSSGNTEI